jgi:hypothetical protein
MENIEELLKELEYSGSSHYHRLVDSTNPSDAHLMKLARQCNIDGIYTFNTSSQDQILNKNILSEKPVVFIAQAKNEQEAKDIHRKLWNLGQAPFLIILLPLQIRIYTGFDYSRNNRVYEERGLLKEISLDSADLHAILKDFSTDSIDSGFIWKSNIAKSLDTRKKVNVRLLENLRGLESVLCKRKIKSKTAHALIGKYIYLRYLWDRELVTENFLHKYNIQSSKVFGRDAKVIELERLVTILENLFNGGIFPLDFEGEFAPSDEHVSLTASVFSGDELQIEDDRIISQLHLDFQAYDFQYIPIETLSAIYEQFIDQKKEKGAFYTPEVLADYLISEMNASKELREGQKILDPACGSGIFLVLAFRKLIEHELRKRGKITIKKLGNLLSNIFGIEREVEACYVAEFSLLLTMLNYIDTDLDSLVSKGFRFPTLHNKQIFHGDFFDNNVPVLNSTNKFDWIIGNPPWITIKPGSESEQCALSWIRKNNRTMHVSGNRVAEAFCWRATESIAYTGIIGFVLPATSLFNLTSKSFRQNFFKKNKIFRVTNFSNLRMVLFDGRAVLPAITLIFRPGQDEIEENVITHYGPFIVNQVFLPRHKPWVLTINESETQTIIQKDTLNGESIVWKMALWGSRLDEKVISYIRNRFSTTLDLFCKNMGWGNNQPTEGPEFRPEDSNEKVEYKPELVGMLALSTLKMADSGHLISVPNEALLSLSKKDCYLRKRGGERGLEITHAPHIIISYSWGHYIAYSGKDFVIPPRQFGIAGNPGDEKVLKALTIYLNSSLVSFYMFFVSQQWGVFKQALRQVSLQEVKKIPVPTFTDEQIEKLARVYTELEIYDVKENQDYLKQRASETIFNVLDIPSDYAERIDEFISIKLLLDEGPTKAERIIKAPSPDHYTKYASRLRDHLDLFTSGSARHKLSINWSYDLTECIVEIQDRRQSKPIDIEVMKSDITNETFLEDLRNSIGEKFSQWIYIQRSIRMFDGPLIYIYKPSRLLDWTVTQAANDADDIIGEILSAEGDYDQEY